MLTAREHSAVNSENCHVILGVVGSTTIDVRQLGSVLVASGSFPLISVIAEDVIVQCTH